MNPYKIALRRNSAKLYDTYIRENGLWLGNVTEKSAKCWTFWLSSTGVHKGHYKTRHEAAEALWKAHRRRR